jgi:hypothetical protein
MTRAAGGNLLALSLAIAVSVAADEIKSGNGSYIWLFRGLLGVHSRCGPHGRLTSRRGLFSECFRPFVAS